MNIQQMLDNAVQADRQKELTVSDQLLLGELILKLEAVKDKSKPLFIDTGDRPMGVDSYRGIYRELAIQTERKGRYYGDIKETTEYGDIHERIYIGKENPTVSEWIEVLKEAIGKTFEGYKGGDFTMSKNTPVWLAEWGDSGFGKEYELIYFVDVQELDDKVEIVTYIKS